MKTNFLRGINQMLKNLKSDRTLLINSGKPKTALRKENFKANLFEDYDRKNAVFVGALELIDTCNLNLF